ncbi:uncharacterized protein LOC129939255 [Eupeodes corollae]|uniref:uncharacterized protein LOC129939255 n=1 Tax=Eupeodes corollae TaxID=290404 RepID=UPI00248FBBFF|nr:uncharacterized protein LOC129939255 [Eupeodes corollae]
MIYIPRLRDVLKKLETRSDLARSLIKRASIVNVIDGEREGTSTAMTIVNKDQEHGDLSSSDEPSAVVPTATTTSSTQSVSVTSVSGSLASPLTRVGGIGYGYGPRARAPPGTNEIKLLMYNNNSNTHHEKHQPKTIRAALFNASLFSRAASNGSGAVILESQSNSRDLREQDALNKQQQKQQSQTKTTEEQIQNQSSASQNMSEAKVKEEVVVMTQHHQPSEGDATTKQLDETSTAAASTKVSCNGASCGENSGEIKEKSCFQSSLADILRFMELVGNLKHTKRTGWVLRDVNDCESISGHMYRMSMMTFLLEEKEGLNRIRCMELALVHDLAESLVGDLTPFCGVAKEDKKAMELSAMADICKLVDPRGKRIMELFEEYEEGQSAESKFVKDLDRLDMVMQAFEYEKRDNCLMKHQEFFDSTEGKFQHPFIQKLVKEICDQRKSLAEANVVAKGELNLKTVTPNCPPCLEHKMEHKNERS